MPTIARGQWTQSGSGSLNGKLWVSDGSLANAQLQDGTVITAGHRFGDNVPNGIGGHGDDPDQGCFITWVTSAWDTLRSQMMVSCGSGDQGWMTNEVNAFDLPNDGWAHVTDPPTRLFVRNLGLWAPGTVLGRNVSGDASPYALIDTTGLYHAHAVPDALSGQYLYPNGRQHYGGMIYMPSVDKFLLWGGIGWYSINGGAHLPFEWSPATAKWEGQTKDMPGNTLGSQFFSVTQPLMRWDSTQNRVLVFCGSVGDSLIAYSPGQPQGSRWSVVQNHLGDVLPFVPSSNNYAQLVYDSKRRWLLMFGGQLGCVRWDLSGPGGSVVSTTQITITGDVFAGPGNQNGPGVLYDPVADLYVGWIGGQTLYRVTPSSGTTMASQAVHPGGVTPTVPQLGATGVGGVWNRFDYLPTYDVYAEISHSADSGAFVYAPVRTVPALMCTDLASGNRTGNPDTAFGQTANVDGVYVTVYGFNLGASTDTVGVTVGGVACTIIDRGDCTATRSPAVLKNTYMNGQMIVFQLNHACPLGSQPLDVTVNGVASTATDLTFTVTSSGTIRIISSNIQTTFNNMVTNDVTYITNGVTLSGLAMGSNTTGANPGMALGAYPGATVTFGTPTQSAIWQNASGAGRFLTFFKLNCRGGVDPINTSQAVTIVAGSRFIGCNVQVPTGFGSSGALGCHEAGQLIGANEFTNCGTVGAAPDDQYHVIYKSGTRDQVTRQVESGYRCTMNYIHDNNAATRAFNCFANNNQQDNAIADVELDHNVVVNQQWAAAGILGGVVGTNKIHDNLFVRCGLNTGGNSGAPAVGAEIRAGYPSDWNTTTAPIAVQFYGNTFVDCGDTSASVNNRGDYHIKMTSGAVLYIQGNIHYQSNGIQYVSSDSDVLTVNAALRSNNDWFGGGPVPSFETGGLTANPLFISPAANNYRLQSTSPMIGAGVALGLTDTDLDGTARPGPGTRWDIGALQFGTTVATAAPVLVALSPASCLPGAASFTLTIFADPGSPFTAGAQIFWDGATRATTFVNSQQCTITVPAADVASPGAHLVTATNPGSLVSNSLQFNVSLGPVTLSLSWQGLLRDRVGEGTTALSPDGHFDGTLLATVSNLQGRTITKLVIDNLTVTGRWSTDTADNNFVLGAALTLDGAYLNNLATMAVNFTVADGGTFVAFITDAPSLGLVEFPVGAQLRMTATISDGLTAQATATVSNTTPTLTQLQPNTMALGNPALVMNCVGTNFVNGCTVRWNGGSRATVFLSSTLVQATVLATDLLPPPQTALVTVQNPDGATSGALPFTTTFAQQTGIFVGVVM